jgi:hypothetical protein
VALPFEPGVIVKASPNIIFYDGKNVVLPRWATLPDEGKQAMARWVGDEAHAKELFEAAFHWFFVAHELGHFVQESRAKVLDHWEQERYANEVAVAFWRTQPDGNEKLQRFQKLIEFSTARMNPTYGRRYDKATIKPRQVGDLGNNPEDYGYFQFNLILDILKASSTKPTFTETVVERTKGGVDCRTVGTRLTKSCPALPDPDDICRKTVFQIGTFLNPGCESLGAQFIDCYAAKEGFSSCKEVDENGVPPLQAECIPKAEAMVNCASK